MADEQHLIVRLQYRDRDALSQVFSEHADEVYRLAVSLLYDEQQADGVGQIDNMAFQRSYFDSCLLL